MNRATPKSRKGELTYTAIVEAALEIAGRDGLQGLTVGTLAKKMGMSKSGVFVHFGSRDALLLAVLRQYQDGLARELATCRLHALRGLPRMQAIFRDWAARTAAYTGNWIYFQSTMECGAQPDSVRDELVGMARKQHELLQACIGQAIASCELRPDTSARQLAFEIHGLIMALAYEARVLKLTDSVEHAEAGYIRLIDGYRTHGPSSGSGSVGRPGRLQAKPEADAFQRFVSDALAGQWKNDQDGALEWATGWEP